MKRFVIAIVLLVFSISVCGFCFWYYNRTVSELQAALDAALQATENEATEQVQQETEALLQLWEEKGGILHILAMHRELEEVELNILSLPDHLDVDDSLELYREACIRAKEQLNNLRDSEQVALRNIF